MEDTFEFKLNKDYFDSCNIDFPKEDYEIIFFAKKLENKYSVSFVDEVEKIHVVHYSFEEVETNLTQCWIKI